MLRENSPFVRDRTEASPHAGVVLDPIALEDRLRVAREQRAEALARRQVSVRPRPLAPAPRQPLRAPVTELVDTAPPSLSVRRPRAVAPAAEAPAQEKSASPLVLLLALGLSAPFVLSHFSREAPPIEREKVASAPPAVSAPAVAEIAAAPDPAPAQAIAIAAPAADPAPAKPMIVSPIPADPPRIVESAAEPAPPAPPAQAEPQMSAAPRAERILVNAPSSVPTDAVDATLAALKGTGFSDVSLQPTRLTIRTSSVRYYHDADADAAFDVAALIGPGLPGGAIEARDFSDAASRGAPGHIEVWIAGAPGAAPAATPAPPPSEAQGVDPDQIRRLVESVFSPESVEDLGRGAADIADNIGNGVANVARGIDDAVTGATRFLEGRP